MYIYVYNEEEVIDDRDDDDDDDVSKIMINFFPPTSYMSSFK